jgi:hypothetical protein
VGSGEWRDEGDEEDEEAIPNSQFPTPNSRLPTPDSRLPKIQLPKFLFPLYPDKSASFFNDIIPGYCLPFISQVGKP